SFFSLKCINLFLSTLSAITCGHPGNPTSGRTNGSEFNLNDVVNFTCNRGYTLSGNARAQCRLNGQWSSPLPVCKGICGDPGIPNHGARLGGQEFKTKSLLRFSCEAGYSLIGSHRTCKSDGRWSGKPPLCKGIQIHLKHKDLNMLMYDRQQYKKVYN
uniref:Sushi domain-containing protein n=1 Tax=Echeneis naucrates TaxID=173247 RepID=A0A665UU47_ECHNA